MTEEVFEIVTLNNITLRILPVFVCIHMEFDFWQALIHGLNRHYYSIGINYRKNELEQKVHMYFMHKNSLTREKMLAYRLLVSIVSVLAEFYEVI